MEINTQQMEALLHLQEQQAQLPRRNGGQAQGFEDILSQELENGAGQAHVASDSALAGTASALYSQMMLDNADAGQRADIDAEVLQAAFDQASGALTLWDSYAKTLGNSTTDTALRDAYALLEGIGSQVAQLRQSPARGKDSGLDSILNELEILAATEKFKFNRGDYLL